MFPISHWEDTWSEQPACPCLSCSLLNWRQLTWALLCPLLCVPAGKWDHTKLPCKGHCSVSEAGLRCDWGVSPNSGTCRPLSVPLSLRDAWQMGEGVTLWTCQAENTRWVGCAFLPNKSVMVIHMPPTATETLWLVNSWLSSPWLCLLWIVVPKGLVLSCLFTSLNKFKTLKNCSCYTRADFSFLRNRVLLHQLDFFCCCFGRRWFNVQLLVLSIIHELLYSGLFLLLPGGYCG